MKKTTMNFLIVTLISLGITTVGLEKTVYAKTSLSIYRNRVKSVKWPHPYRYMNDVYNSDGDIINGEDYKYFEYIQKDTASKLPSIPTQLRGTWYYSNKSHVKFTKYHFYETKSYYNKFNKYSGDYSKIGKYKASAAKYTSTYYTQGGKTYVNYDVRSKGIIEGGTHFYVKDSHGKKHNALLLKTGSDKFAILYKTKKYNLPHSFESATYEDEFGGWDSDLENNINQGKTVTSKQINASNKKMRKISSEPRLIIVKNKANAKKAKDAWFSKVYPDGTKKTEEAEGYEVSYNIPGKPTGIYNVPTEDYLDAEFGFNQ